MDEEINIIEIQSEYERIDGEWLILHFKASVGLVIFTFLIECIISGVLYNLGEINTSISFYIMKYVLVPVVTNVSLIIIGYLAINSSRLKHNVKIYIVSLLLSAICFIVFSVHSIFISVYMIFTIPILFTVVYGDYILTTITALCSILAKTFSECFIIWNPIKFNIIDSHMRLINFIISICFLLAFYAVCIVVIYFERGKNAVSLQRELERFKLQQRLHNDELTSINNRTALRKAFQSMEEDISGSVYIFVMIDIDNFKLLNDTWGHAKGDLILSEFGEILKINCANAMPFRFGGDEFCIIFKNQTLNIVIETCESIQNDFKEMVADNNLNEQLTVSFGIARYSHGMTATQILKNADSALYSAKTIKDAIHIYEDLVECQT
ncbi:diguanylate cyclase [Sedimentibacter acidaminivorans]|uniref:Diguanylate cyclase n=1 Tax=Sedimentibacter acidaminivorans TaxID=913099 RepID=A0ABS4G979_9FIRM|nr:GGDEF domain-containing protein [Sedimentibacter acidaminivorans]MBP1924250.1 diguanylate cyclase [Sedimentibacter acidaminivorans]